MQVEGTTLAILAEKVRLSALSSPSYIMSHSKFRSALLVSFAVLVSGCIRFDHSIIDEPIKPVRSLDQRQCCDSILGLEVHPLAPNKYLTVVVDESDAVLEFKGGKSFTKAIELPVVEVEYILQMDSVVNTPGLNLIPQAMYPMVTLLDAQLNTIATFDNESLDYRRPIFGPRLLRIIITVEAGSAARYALLHTSPSRRNQGITANAEYELVQREDFETLIYSRPTQTRHKIQFIETGMVNLLAYTNP